MIGLQGGQAVVLVGRGAFGRAACGGQRNRRTPRIQDLLRQFWGGVSFTLRVNVSDDPSSAMFGSGIGLIKAENLGVRFCF